MLVDVPQQEGAGPVIGRLYELAAVLAAIGIIGGLVAVGSRLARGLVAALDGEEPLPPEWVNDQKEEQG